jgi:hypothetical protein
VNLRPTIIGGKATQPASPDEPQEQELRPTVIGPSAPMSLPVSPTALPATTSTAQPFAAMPAVEAPVPKATAIPNSPPVSASPAPAAASAGAVAKQVTRVLGVERKGLAIDASELRGRHADASAAAIDQAVTLLAGIVPQTCSAANIEHLGRASQEGVARVVDRVLRIVDEEVPRTAGRHVERMLELLGDIADVLKPGGIGWRRKSLRQVLSDTRGELDALRAVLERSEASLVDQREKLVAMHGDVNHLLDGLNGVLVALAELRPVFADNRRQQAIDQRETDVAKSVALLQTHSLQMQRLEQDFTQLAQRIRDAVLHALPAWLSAAASSPHESLNETERFTLMDQLHALMLVLSHKS